ncbi:MAG: CBS domain-containing protein [Defluviicoccus sp.]|nr:MAG: CBS domain-containing protein [Defluviicoccus sp.]
MERPYRTLRQLLASKPAGVVTTGVQATVWEALQLMAEKDVGAVVVVGEGQVIGVLSERDYARKGILLGRTAKETMIREVMNETVITVTPQETVPQCMALMTAHRTRHLPVLEDGQLIGILSIGDLVKEVISHHEHVIKDMELERLILFSQGTYSC